MYRRLPQILLLLGWMAGASVLPAASVSVTAAALRGDEVPLPYRFDVRLEAAACLELRIQELGSDVRATITRDGRPVQSGVDADVARHGKQVIVHCTAAASTFTVDVVAATTAPGAKARVAKRVWTAADGTALFAMAAYADALSQYADSKMAESVAGQLARIAAYFDALDDTERAALAWIFATARAQRALARPLADQAFAAALRRVQALGWTRHQVVLLNNRALFIAAMDSREATRLIDESFALQMRLADPHLAAVIQNNVCLLRYQFGALAQSESCFRRVLRQHRDLGNSSAAFGAARNNLSLAELAQGRYADAEAGFRRAAVERRDGNDLRGQVESLCNLALSLYQLGRPEAAIGQLQEAYGIARGNSDDLGRAHATGFLAGIYLAWGDSDTAWAYASEAEQVFRDTGRVAYLAPLLRLSARIALSRGEEKKARTTIEEAWALAITNDLRQAAANIAPVHALIQLEQGDHIAAADFIADARLRLSRYAGAADLASLGIVELRLLRERGDLVAAAERAEALDRALPYPGFARSQLLVERFLTMSAAPAAEHRQLREAYRELLGALRYSVAVAPDPELALRLQEIARPAAEAAIARELVGCAQENTCAIESLRRALEFFALEPGFGDVVARDGGALRGMLQALSLRQASDDAGAATQQLIASIRREQARARQQKPVFAPSLCPACENVGGSASLFYFFGAAHGWRWQGSGDSWSVHAVPAWPVLALSLPALNVAETRAPALRALAPVLADLVPVDDKEITVGGDPRLLRIPFAAVPLGADEILLDRHAVAVMVAGRSYHDTVSQGVAFVNGENTGVELPMAGAEKEIVEKWTASSGLVAADLPTDGTMLSMLHIVAHGQRDIGAGMSVVWIRGQPLVSYLSAGSYRALTVFINSCDSGAASESAPAQASIASAFIRNGATGVVATHFPVPDRTAANFAREFYAVYDVRRNNLVDAVARAQRELRKRSRDASWAAYYAVVVNRINSSQ